MIFKASKGQEIFSCPYRKAVPLLDLLPSVDHYPYGFEDNIKQICNGKKFVIYSNSDEVGTLYPTVIITCNEAGDLSLANDLDNEVMVIKNCSAGEVITVNSKYKTNHIENGN